MDTGTVSQRTTAQDYLLTGYRDECIAMRARRVRRWPWHADTPPHGKVDSVVASARQVRQQHQSPHPTRRTIDIANEHMHGDREVGSTAFSPAALHHVLALRRGCTPAAPAARTAWAPHHAETRHSTIKYKWSTENPLR
jgi:hypothetical protein